ncbi:MAG TPA: PQQ-dependent sugar dehydrogenase, partial [Nitrospiraceae bacterium]|nr:PQQ-dependent sugar dehydrogenase [Nitrospiraceae bacterium]
GVVVVTIGYLTGCSGTEQDSEIPTSTSATLQTVTTNLTFPVFMTGAPADNIRLFIVEKGGLIRIFNRNSSSVTTFLDLRALILTGGERGLLGMAFDPGYNVTNGQFYVLYTNTTGDIVIARYLTNAANPNIADFSSGTPLLTVLHPNFSNHNGGMLAFGPEGCLYAGVGDGGGSGDPNDNGQSVNSRLGKLLRINPATGQFCITFPSNPFLGGLAPEVWSLGLRNPWRFSFDRVTHDLYIGDVGEGAREEINVSPALNGLNAGRALNYGWRLMEGFLCFNPSFDCNTGSPPLTLPVLDYPHDNGTCAVTGGYVYRGSAMPALQGTYFYGDFCAGFVRSFRYQNGQPTEQTEWPLLSPPGASVTSFGEDEAGELYVMTQGGGLFKFVPN